MKLILAGEPVVLLPEKAVFLPEQETLVVADVHLGKSAAFRARGVPVPEGETGHDLRRLHELVERFQAGRLVVAGDFVHAAAGFTEDLRHRLEEWRETLAAELVLVEGNHDRNARLRGAWPGWGITNRTQAGALAIVHDPDDLGQRETGIAGHIHPAGVVRGPGRGTIRVPLFSLWRGHLVLPAFGSFTGTRKVERREGERWFTPVRDAVREIPSRIV